MKDFTLYKHQETIVDYSRRLKNVALLWDMGTGKTLGAITILRQRYIDHGKVIPTLILGPQSVLFNWKEEIEMFSKIPLNKVFVLHNSAKRVKEFQRAIEKDPNIIVIINYEALIGKIGPMLVDWCPEIVLADEMHMVKNPQAKRSKVVQKLGAQATYRYGLTGTPLLNSVTDVFGQYKFLAPHIFGKSLTVFRSKYMYDANASWSGQQNYFPNWQPRESMFKELYDKIYSIGTRICKSECLDLPPLVEVTRTVEMSAKQKKIYRDMERNFIAFLETQDGVTAVEAQIALTKALRLQQIVCGFIKDEAGQEHDIPGGNPRLTELTNLLEELSGDHKIIVWTSFIHTYGQIAGVCKKLGIGYTMLTGGMNGEKKHESMRLFREDPNTRVIIANQGAGGTGINLVEASYSIVYSRDFSLAKHLQSEARNYRKGSEIHERVTKITLKCPETIDEIIHEALSGKIKISDAVIDHFRR